MPTKCIKCTNWYPSRISETISNKSQKAYQRLSVDFSNFNKLNETSEKAEGYQINVENKVLKPIKGVQTSQPFQSRYGVAQYLDYRFSSTVS